MSRILVASAVLLIVGCGSKDSGPATVKVSGRVMMDGKPLKNVEVSFSTDDFGSTGLTDDEGNFTLISGAVAGKNRVTISKRKKDKDFDDVEEGMDEGQRMAMNPDDPAGTKLAKKDELIPEQYSNPENSILTFLVPEDGTDKANFDLKSKK